MAEGGAGLIERSDAERDEEVTALFNRYYTPMCRLAYVILGDSGMAEEVVMEALLKMFTGWRRIRDVDRVDAYLRRSVVNLCRSKIRRKGLESRFNASLRQQKPAHDDSVAERHHTSQLVWAAVRTLPLRQRACVVLRYYEDLPEAQIADVLDCSIGTVKSQLSKARAKLQGALESDFSGGEQ
jgi:RNA polymerase sigma-70 factor (sigma-E family)